MSVTKIGSFLESLIGSLYKEEDVWTLKQRKNYAGNYILNLCYEKPSFSSIFVSLDGLESPYNLKISIQNKLGESHLDISQFPIVLKKALLCAIQSITIKKMSAWFGVENLHDLSLYYFKNKKEDEGEWCEIEVDDEIFKFHIGQSSQEVNIRVVKHDKENDYNWIRARFKLNSYNKSIYQEAEQNYLNEILNNSAFRF